MRGDAACAAPRSAQPHLPPCPTGLFEQRVEQYLEELPDTEQSGVNKFLRGLGEDNLYRCF